MKKTYINPETIVVDLMPRVGFMENLSQHDEIGTEQWTKEYSDSGSSDNTGSKNVWDEEW